MNNLLRSPVSPFFGSISPLRLVGQYFKLKFSFSAQVFNAAVWQTCITSPYTSIRETVSRREHRLKTCKLLRKKSRQDPPVLYVLGRETAYSLPQPAETLKSLSPASVLVTLCPTQKFEVKLRVMRQEGIFRKLCGFRSHLHRGIQNM